MELISFQILTAQSHVPKQPEARKSLEPNITCGQFCAIPTTLDPSLWLLAEVSFTLKDLGGAQNVRWKEHSDRGFHSLGPNTFQGCIRHPYHFSSYPRMHDSVGVRKHQPSGSSNGSMVLFWHGSLLAPTPLIICPISDKGKKIMGSPILFNLPQADAVVPVWALLHPMEAFATPRAP